MPYYSSIKCESFIAIPSPIDLLKCQPNRPSGGWAISRAVGQTRWKPAKIVNFCQLFSRCSHILYHTQTKFSSSIAIPSPVHLLKFQQNRPTGGRVIIRAVRQTSQKLAKIVNRRKKRRKTVTKKNPIWKTKFPYWLYAWWHIAQWLW